ncbi:MAG: TIGR03752 family integrating conjugative element protein, partial [Gammaproteobacteria bacterium]
MNTSANPIPFILAGVVVVMAAVVGFRGCAESEPETTAAMQAVPQAPPADADTPADTIRTLRAGVAEMTNKFTAMSAENQRLL